MKYLGLDWGKSKIGIAMGSDETKIASPILILNYKSMAEVEKKMIDLIKLEEIETIVIGKPVSLSGHENFSEEFNEFVSLIEKLGVKVEFEDERLSTKYAASLKKQFTGYNKVGDDDIAAAAILQTYLDKNH
jgi:putative holliday junction resolvase